MLSLVTTTVSTRILNGDCEQSEVAFQGMVHYYLIFRILFPFVDPLVHFLIGLHSRRTSPEVCGYGHGGRWVIVKQLAFQRVASFRSS